MGASRKEVSILMSSGAGAPTAPLGLRSGSAAQAIVPFAPDALPWPFARGPLVRCADPCTGRSAPPATPPGPAAVRAEG